MEEVLREMTQDSIIENMDSMNDEQLKKIQDELRLLGYKKTWKENQERTNQPNHL